MKNKLYISAAALALVFVASPVFANTNGQEGDKAEQGRLLSGGPKTSEVKDIREQNKADLQVKREDRLDTRIQNKTEVDAKRVEMDTYLKDMRTKIDAAQTPAEKKAIMDEVKTKLESYKTDMQATQVVNQNEIKAKTADIKATRSMGITKVYTAAIDRFEKISTRIASRLDKIAVANPTKDLTAIKASLADANTKIATAKTGFTSLPQYTDATYKASVEKVKTDLKTAQSALASTTTLMKGVSDSAKEDNKKSAQ